MHVCVFVRRFPQWFVRACMCACTSSRVRTLDLAQIFAAPAVDRSLRGCLAATCTAMLACRWPTYRMPHAGSCTRTCACVGMQGALVCMHMLTFPVAYSVAPDFGQVNISPPFFSISQSAISPNSPCWDSVLDLRFVGAPFWTIIFHLSSNIGPFNAFELGDTLILAICVVGKIKIII